MKSDHVLQLRLSTLPLQGEKTRVRLLKESDLSTEYISWLNDNETVRLSNQRFFKHNKASVRKFFRSFLGSPNAFLAIEDVRTLGLVGTITVYTQPHHGTADVGILLGQRGKGYGKEAWSMTIGWLLDLCRVRKVTAGTLSCNQAMIHLLESAGMHREGIRIAQEIVEGEPYDIVYYAKFRSS